MCRGLTSVAIALGMTAVLAGCVGVQQRFPDDVQAALARDPMRRLETSHFILYYPAHRRAEVDRFLVRAERCAETLRAAAVIHDGRWNEKMVIAMPDAPFNNAFVLAEFGGYEAASVIPTFNTFDLTTEYGLVPDPAFIACHELVHYVHLEQIAGLWKLLDTVFGYLYTPQVGYEPWFDEGLATHYEAKVVPGIGRPTWPIFTGMFAAGYAGHSINGGDLSALGRRASVGHHYLVGTMFVRFLTERYGEPPLWAAIGRQARALTGILFTGSLHGAFGVSFGDLLDQFNAWRAERFPVRGRPAGQRTVATLGNDARYARGRDGTEAWVANDVDAPPRLVVRDPGGAPLADLGLVDVLPPRTLVQADPILVSGLSVTADGREVWLTVIDLAGVYQVPRLLRWRRGESKLSEVSHALGPGATIDPGGETYYFCDVDGDRWSLAAWDVRRGVRRTVVDMQPGTYVLGAQASADGKQLVASVWDGSAFVAWVIDAATGARISEVRATGTPVWDPSFTGDGRVMYLGVVDGRFQVMIDGHAVSDAPYAVLAARSGAGAGGAIRFLNRDGWRWTLDEITEPPAIAPATVAVAVAPPPSPSPSPLPSLSATVSPSSAAPPPAAAPSDAPPGPAVQSDQPFSPWEHLFFPQLRAPVVIAVSTGLPHIGVILGGGDRLGMQRWSAAGYVQPRDKTADKLHWAADVGYLNLMLAPWQILALAGFIDWVDPVSTDDPDVTLAEERRTRDASLSLARTWRGTLTTALSGVYTDDVDRLPGERELRRHLGGASLSLSWRSGESTVYTDTRRGLVAGVSAAYYPQALSSFAGDIYDTGGTLGVIAPLPFGRRHTVTATLRGRALIAHGDTDLLQLGGESGLAELWSGRSTGGEPPVFDTRRFPPNLRFIEALRGYEDYAITTERAAIAELSWRYPLIIDRGVAATFGFLPASFIRQLDVEGFATGAIDDQRDLHAAAGAMVSLRFTLFRVPLFVAYQVARRVRDDRALTQLVGLTIDL